MDVSTPPPALRQRRGTSYTNVPNSDGAIVVEETPIPSSKRPPSLEEESPVPSKILSGNAVSKDENRKRKILVRVSSGALMVSRAVRAMFSQ